MEPLSARVLDDSTVYPTIRVESHPNRLLMGVFDSAGDYVPDSGLDRSGGLEIGAPIPRDLFPDVTDSEAPEAIYAGTFYHHFGHFLLESLARVWYARQHPELPLVWAGSHRWESPGLRPWEREILDVLGLANPTMILNRPMRFRRLHVPDIGYRYPDRFHPEHAAFLARYDDTPQVPGERLWLSRGGVESDARDVSAGPTERRLAAAGWTVVRPESLTIHEQLEHLSRAEVVAGEEGSAFHTLILLKDISKKRFEIFRRRGPEHPNMTTIGDARDVDQTFHTLENERVVSAAGRVVSKVNPNSSEILDILEVPVPPPPGVPAGQEAVRRAVMTFAPAELLDVGSSTSELATVPAKARVAVSRHFDFDPRSLAAEGSEFYELDLRQYATSFRPKGRRFDVIRLTGVDFEEVMAAFEASKRLGRVGAAWVLGSGELAARVALAIHLTHPGFTSSRLDVAGETVFVARRIPGAPMYEVGVGRMPDDEVAERADALPVTFPRPTMTTRARSVAGRVRRRLARF